MASSKRTTIIIDLQKRGYELDFVLKNGSISCLQDKSMAMPEDFEIIERHLVIDNRSLENTWVILAVQIASSNRKGILMAGYCHNGDKPKKLSNHEN